jgi:hypothetical protein
MNPDEGEGGRIPRGPPVHIPAIQWWCWTEIEKRVVHCKEDLNNVFPEIKLRGLVPNFHFHTSVRAIFIYSQDRSTWFAGAKTADRSWDYIDRSQIYECINWDFLGIFFSNFRYSIFTVCMCLYRSWNISVNELYLLSAHGIWIIFQASI